MKQLKPSLITLAILLTGLALTPYIALSSAPIRWQRYAAAYLPPPTPPTSVTIAGPTTGAVNTSYTFTATVSPITATLPLTYTWQATGQGIVMHTLISSTSDVAAFTWTTPGARAITVTASNVGGSSTGLHTITLATPPANVNLTGPISGSAGMVYTFTAAVSTGTTTPITYTWQATNRSPETHTSGLTDTMAWVWPSGTTGAQAITVTAANAVGAVTGTHLITLTTTSACSRPLSATRISGPTLGYTGTLYTFTAVLTPSDATLPITYTWSPAPASGQGIASASYQWVVSGVNAITLTAQNCGGTFSATHVIAVQAAPGPVTGGDAYEPDDTCSLARPITTDGVIQAHTFHAIGDNDWVSFPVISGTTYIVEARVPMTSSAAIVLDIRDACPNIIKSQYPTFSPDVRLQFQAPSSGVYYLHLVNGDPDTAGPEVAYYLSVRTLPATSSPGALVLVAGRLRIDDPLNANILNTTDAVYKLFQAHGYSHDRIRYLANDARSIEGENRVFAPPSQDTLQQTLTQWALDKVGPDRALTLYMMDHGGIDYLYLNGSSQTVTPADINGWLNTLEAATGARVNVIIEACHSGSFVDSLSQSEQTALESIQGLSKLGRVVIVSTGTEPVAYASANGAVFSDAFIGALGLDMSLYNSFQVAREMASIAHPDQTPRIDDNQDGQEAQKRGFSYAGTFPAEKSPPYIVWAKAGQVIQGTTVISAEVRDERGVISVWVDVYEPSYMPPPPGDKMVQVTLPSARLDDLDHDRVYTGIYKAFAEIGEYRLVIYAVDGDNLLSRPKEIKVRTGWKMYLPIVLK